MAARHGGAQRRPFSRVGGIVLIVLIILVAAVLLFSSHPLSGRADWPSSFRSNGERIYFTGMTASGRRLNSQSEGMHMDMMGGGCVTCHGVNREGGRLMPRFWKTVPPLTPAALFNEAAEGGEHDGHGDHEEYTDETLRRAISRGVDPGGNPLDPAMPRWPMSDQDLDDLIAYLKSPVGKHR